MTTITAETILSSEHADVPGLRLTTMLLRYPRPIHAELMTHRMFSRNAASSRAIPVKKMITDVQQNPFIPLVWGKNQKGMQSSEECHEQVHLPASMRVGNQSGFDRQEAWLRARDMAVEAATAFNEAGYHKQIVNRLLEPFTHITVLVSSTTWSNFLGLRDHAAAEPHIAMLAQEVRRELDKPVMQTLLPCEWHAPFAGLWASVKDINAAIRLSVACCASTSYKTVDGFGMTPEKAQEIHDKLLADVPVHASPAEHVAKADVFYEGNWFAPQDHRNFVGFRQYRAGIAHETL